MKVLNEYPNSHYYWEEYEKCDYFCPYCGKQEVWKETGEGNYYAGSSYICIACNGVSYLSNGGIATEPNWLGIVEQLKSGVTKKPTTKPGN